MSRPATKPKKKSKTANIENEQAATKPTRTHSLWRYIESLQPLTSILIQFSLALVRHYIWLHSLVFWNKANYIEGLVTLGLLQVFLSTAWTLYNVTYNGLPTLLQCSNCSSLVSIAIPDVTVWFAPKLLLRTPVYSQIFLTGCDFLFWKCLRVYIVAPARRPVLRCWSITLTTLDVLYSHLLCLACEVSQACVSIYSEVQAAILEIDCGHKLEENQRKKPSKIRHDEAEFDHPLGFGEYYSVSAMIIRRTYERFARKFIKLSVQSLDVAIREKVTAGLRSEAAILMLIQSQPHLHLPILRGSNLDGDDIYIDVFPVGNSDLKKFFDDFYISEQRLDLKKQIIQGFSCLAAQLEHLHKRLKIFHGDIRPRNVINVHGRMVLIDYSMSVVLSDVTKVVDRAHFLSRLTSAPECLSSSPRGFPADIFSLGVAFTYMLTVLCEKSVETLEKRKNKKHKNQEFGYSNNIKWVRETWLPSLKYEAINDLCSREDFEHLKRLTHEMLDEKPGNRPDVSAIRFGRTLQTSCCPRFHQSGLKAVLAISTSHVDTGVTCSQIQVVEQHPDIVVHASETVQKPTTLVSDLSDASTCDFPDSDAVTLVPTANLGDHSPSSPYKLEHLPSGQRSPSPTPPQLLAYTNAQFDDCKVEVDVKKTDALSPLPVKAWEPKLRRRKGPAAVAPSPALTSVSNDSPYVPGRSSKLVADLFQTKVERELTKFYSSGSNDVTATFPGIKMALEKEAHDSQVSPISKRMSLQWSKAVVDNDTDDFIARPPRRQRTMS